MRFLSYLIGILILVNVAVLVWPQKNSVTPHLSIIQEEVNPHFIRLNKEIETRFYTQTERDIEVDSVDDNNVVAILSEDSEVESSPSAGKLCYRVGPFAHRSNYKLAQAVLFNAKVDYKKSRRKSRESVVTRLYLGPYDSKAQVEDERLKLRESGVLDHFVRAQEGQYIISLGIYSSEQSSIAALELFREKIAAVQQREEKVVLPESYWLHFAIDEEQSVQRKFASMDWGEPSAKVGLHDCFEG